MQQYVTERCTLFCREPVTAVSWHSSSASDPLLGNTEESDLLVSLGSDGRLLLWNWHTAELLHG